VSGLRLDQIPPSFTSIDPGSVHCGVARWEYGRIGERIGPNGRGIEFLWEARLVEAYERSPIALEMELEELAQDRVGLVICEDWRLQKGRNRQGDRVETAKVIGVIEYLARKAQVPVHLQDASIKSYGESWLRAAGIDPVSTASNQHKRDAITHGVYAVWREKRTRDRVSVVFDRDRRGAVAAR
jgi:hypothetical protein